MQDIVFIIDDQEDNDSYKKPSRWNRFKRKAGLFLLFTFFLPAAVMALMVIVESLRKAQEQRRYKKVIKKGLFWDTEYLIEKD